MNKERRTNKQTNLRHREQTGGARREVGGEMGEVDKGVKSTLDRHWDIYRIIESLYYTPATNIIPYVNYTWIKKNKDGKGNVFFCHGINRTRILNCYSLIFFYFALVTS